LDAPDLNLALTLIAAHNTSNAPPRALVSANDNNRPTAPEPR
jgi:hypothetical protein